MGQGERREESHSVCFCSSEEMDFPLLVKHQKCWTELTAWCQGWCGFVWAQFQIALIIPKCQSDYCLIFMWVEALCPPQMVKVCQTWCSTALQVTATDVTWGWWRQCSGFIRKPVRRRQSVIRKHINTSPSIPQERKGRNSLSYEYLTPSKYLRLPTTCALHHLSI